MFASSSCHPRLIVACLIVFGAGSALAQSPGSSDAGVASTDPLLELLLETENQLNQIVVTSTKTARRAASAPSIVTVITAEEIAARGYGTVAEALRTVPGFYDVYDLALHNVGVRGINGGARAAGSALKVMIDGVPVAFMPTTGNFFGEELVPMMAVARIEVIRGPVSAVYGANAFLGVVNIITRTAEDAPGVRVAGSFGMVREHPGGGGAAMASARGERLSVSLAAQFRYSDRSGLALPSLSPRLAREDDTLAARGLSRNDTRDARSLVGKMNLREFGGGELSLQGAMQWLDTAGEFQDFGPLSHGTRLGLFNQNWRLSWARPLGDKADLTAAATISHGTVTDGDRLNVGRADMALLRDMSATAFTLSVESRQHAFDGRLTLSEGVEGQLEDHLVQRFDKLLLTDLTGFDGTVVRPAGSILPADDKGARQELRNLGLFVQALADLNASWVLVASGRLDVHSRFGVQPAGRVAVVWAPPEGAFSAKLLGGTSYKAPSAEQLFTQPMAVMDIRGSPALRPQHAYTVEASGSWRLPSQLGEVTANAYFMSVADRVEYVQTGLYLQAQNVQDEFVVGGELDARVTPVRWLQLRLGLGVARSIAVEANQTIVGLPEVRNALFPVLQAHASASFILPGEIRLTPEVSWISERAASQSNALQNGNAYAVPAYLSLGLAASTPTWRWLGDRGTSFTLRLSDLLNRRWAEPGFGGVDVPTQGITGLLTLTQEL